MLGLLLVVETTVGAVLLRAGAVPRHEWRAVPAHGERGPGRAAGGAHPDPQGPAGHAVIPELSWPAYQADKQRLKQVQLELAKLASAGIVYNPAAKP